MTDCPTCYTSQTCKRIRKTTCLVSAPEAHVCHECAHLLGHHEQEIDHVLGLALELGSQLRVLQGGKDSATASKEAKGCALQCTAIFCSS
jgi:hypothetical protein